MHLGLVIHNLRGSTQGPLPVFRVYQLDHIPAYQFLLRIPKEALTGGTDEDKAALGVDHADRVEQEIHDFA